RARSDKRRARKRAAYGSGHRLSTAWTAGKAVAAAQQLCVNSMTLSSKCLRAGDFNPSVSPLRRTRSGPIGGSVAMTIATRATLLATLSSLAFAAPAMAQVNTQAQRNAPGPVTGNDQTIVVTGTRTANRTVA